ncbi:MAG TPA: hypothetical protein VH186_01420 [Chloroflexia bacterium]|nr:hypothetical protein [Chloroflexia bacterium]
MQEPNHADNKFTQRPGQLPQPYQPYCYPPPFPARRISLAWLYYLLTGFAGMMIGYLIGEGVARLTGYNLKSEDDYSTFVGWFCLMGIALGVAACYYFRSNMPQIKAPRLARKKKLALALQVYADAGRRDDVIWLLRTYLPNWRISHLLTEVVNEILLLTGSVEYAEKHGIAASLTDPVAEEAYKVLPMLWHKAESLVTIAGYAVSSPELEIKLASEAASLQRIGETAKQARSWLSELTLENQSSTFVMDASQDLDNSEIRLRSFVEAARSLEKL